MSFFILGDVAYSEFYAPLTFPFCMQSMMYVILPVGVCLGLDFDIRLCDNSINVRSTSYQ